MKDLWNKNNQEIVGLADLYLLDKDTKLAYDETEDKSFGFTSLYTIVVFLAGIIISHNRDYDLRWEIRQIKRDYHRTVVSSNILKHEVTKINEEIATLTKRLVIKNER